MRLGEDSRSKCSLLLPFRSTQRVEWGPPLRVRATTLYILPTQRLISSGNTFPTLPEMMFSQISGPSEVLQG